MFRNLWVGVLAADATLRDVVLVVRADEAHHRDINHNLASELSGPPTEPHPISPYPRHVSQPARQA